MVTMSAMDSLVDQAEDMEKEIDVDLYAELMQHLTIAPAANNTSSKMQPGSSTSKSAGPQISLDEFVVLTYPLIDLEKQAEIAHSQELLSMKDPAKIADSKKVMQNLKVLEKSRGPLERTLITLVTNTPQGMSQAPLKLGRTKISRNSIVDIRRNREELSEKALTSGVVFKMTDEQLVICLDTVPNEGLDRPLQLELLANEVTYQRLKENLVKLKKAGLEGPQAGRGRLAEVLFGTAKPEFVETPRPWKQFNQGLDASQVSAVDKALAAKDIALIHGPPGTGKSTAVVELILQELARDNKILAAAASNMAVDNLVEKIVQASPKVNLVRVGHPARILPQVLEKSLEAAALRSDSGKNAKRCVSDIKAANARMLKLGHRDHAERKALLAEIKMLTKEEQQWQKEATRECLTGASIVCATLTGSGSFLLQPYHFSLVVIDEAAQAMEVDSWAALLKAPRAVLAGDHLQLPPTIISKEAEKKGLGRTLFERLQDLYGDSISKMLKVQYRMHEDIMTWSSDEMYGGNVRAHSTNAHHVLSDLQGVSRDGPKDEDMTGPLLLIDTTGCDMVEEVDDDFDDSKLNPGEARVALQHCRRLLDAGVAMTDIGIITPYSAQVACIKSQRPEELEALEVGTVDGFQGREKEAIVISMVRSNDEGIVGFLADNRRMNVAVTRARRHCALVCDTETVSHDKFIKRLVEYFENHGGYISAAQLDEE